MTAIFVVVETLRGAANHASKQQARFSIKLPLSVMDFMAKQGAGNTISFGGLEVECEKG
jgi:hypothetical protein